MNKIYIIVIILILILGGFLAFFRSSSPEDLWICEDGKWVAHGNPSSSIPLEACIKGDSDEGIKNGLSLDLSNRGLVKTPEYVFNMKELASLNLSNNKLDGSLQSQINQLNNLKSLDLSDNNFTGVPAEIGQLSKLEILDLSNNPITGLPYELGNLKNLKKLDLRGTNYSTSDLNIIKRGLPSEVIILTDDSEQSGEEQIFCTMDAKQCPDGSYVGRVGPNCEFAPCP